MAIVNKKSSKYLCFVSWSIRGSMHRSWSPHGYDHNSFDLHFEAGTIPLTPIKDPNDHPPLILQLIFVGTFDIFVRSLSSSTFSSPSPLSLNSFLPSLAKVGQLANLSSSICDSRWSLVSHFSTTDETTANEPCLLFAFFASHKSDPFIFPKMFTNSSVFSLSQMFTSKAYKNCSSKTLDFARIWT